jgi:thiol:disulfide interchange protein DsbD
MRRLLALCLPLLLLLSTAVLVPRSVEAEGLNWHTYQEGLNLSKAENKTMLLDFYTDWCTYCKQMDKDTYGDARVVNKSAQMVCVKVNGDNENELVSKYGIEGYPTIVFVDVNGTEKDRLVGYTGPEDFLNYLSYILGETKKPVPKTTTAKPCLFGLIPLLIMPALFLHRKKGGL